MATLTREQERELFWQRLESFYKIEAGIKRLAAHQAKSDRLRLKENRLIRWILVAMILSVLSLTILYGQSLHP